MLFNHLTSTSEEAYRQPECDLNATPHIKPPPLPKKKRIIEVWVVPLELLFVCGAKTCMSKTICNHVSSFVCHTAIAA